MHNALVEKKAHIIATARITRAAAAIFEYKAEHGAYPESLPDSALKDPYDLKPLRYRREDKGFVIYSVGPTLRYDGNTSDLKVVAKESVFQYW